MLFKTGNGRNLKVERLALDKIKVVVDKPQRLDKLVRLVIYSCYVGCFGI